MLHLAALTLSMLVLTGSAGSAQAQTPDLQVVPLPRDGQVLVTFKLAGPLTDDMRAAIQSGLNIKFVYTVDLKRGSAVWFDRTIAERIVTATVQYDTLTRRYSVSRLIDGRTEWSDSTEQEDVAWNWLTGDFVKMSLFGGVPLEANGEYYIRVRAHTTPHNASFIWPWQSDAVVGFGKFTFLR